MFIYTCIYIHTGIYIYLHVYIDICIYMPFHVISLLSNKTCLIVKEHTENLFIGIYIYIIYV